MSRFLLMAGFSGAGAGGAGFIGAGAGDAGIIGAVHHAGGRSEAVIKRQITMLQEELRIQRSLGTAVYTECSVTDLFTPQLPPFATFLRREGAFEEKPASILMVCDRIT